MVDEQPPLSPPPSSASSPLSPRVTAISGVAVVATPQHTISSQLKAQVDKVLAPLDEDRSVQTVILGIATEKGVNLAVASRVGDGPNPWEIGAWIGKSGWEQPLREGWEGGVAIRKVVRRR